MTVGIAAICEAEDEPKIILAADRLVTTGVETRIEYEHTSSKMVEIEEEDSEPFVCMGVAAGAMSFADEFFYKLDENVRRNRVGTVREVAKEGIDSFQSLVKESVNRQVLEPQGLTLRSFNEKQQQLHPEVLSSLYQDIVQKQEEVNKNLNTLIAGVDETGAHIYSVHQGDMAHFDSIGYHTIGSGSPPAKSSFIRNRYDDSCTLDDALLSVAESKMQSEEAQGVGTEMDMAVLSANNGIQQVGQSEIKQLRSLQEQINDAQQDARRRIISGENYSFN